jgi:hypothetical protein
MLLLSISLQQMVLLVVADQLPNIRWKYCDVYTAISKLTNS